MAHHQPSPTPDPERATPFAVGVAPAEAGAVALLLKGELDLQAVATFEATVAELAADARVVVDLRELAFMDSSGVAALLRLDQRMRGGGGAVRCLVAPQGPVRRLVDLTQLGEMLELEEAPDGAAGIDPESSTGADGRG